MSVEVLKHTLAVNVGVKNGGEFFQKENQKTENKERWRRRAPPPLSCILLSPLLRPSMRLSRCLSDLGITDVSTFDGCDDVDDELKAIRRIYLRKVLTEHPVSIVNMVVVPRASSVSLRFVHILIYPGATLPPTTPPTPSPSSIGSRTRRRTRAGMYPPSARPRRRGRCFAIYSTAAA